MAFTLERIKRRRATPEADFQSRLVAILRDRLIDAVVFHIPNGVNMPIPAAMKLRRMGLLSGIPDLGILHSGGKILFLECKADAGRLSPTQIDIIDEMRRLGHRVDVVRDVSEALTFCADVGIRISESVVNDASSLFKQETVGLRRRRA